MYSVKFLSCQYIKAEMDLESVTIMLAEEMPSISFASRHAITDETCHFKG